MKSLINRYPQTLTTLLAFFVLASGIAIYLYSLTPLQIEYLLHY